MRIVPYGSMFRDDFVRLNRAWIEKRFELEEKDIELFDNLDSYAESGSIILLGEEDGEIIATCMAIPKGGGVWDLVKLTTAEGHRGRGHGTTILRACLDEIARRGGAKAVLSTCSVFEDAVHIYRREGFVDVTADQEFSFGRTDLQMAKTLTPGSSSGRPS